MPQNIQEIVLKLNSFSSFNPVQTQALEQNILTKTTVVSAPTSSGKTLLAHLTALDCILNRRKKVIYTCPLRALASEHFHEFKEKYSKELDIRIAVSTGDLDSTSKYLSKYDLIVSTNEKLESLLRHNADWLKQVGLLIVDEIHTLDSDRGPVIEMVIAKLKMLNPDLQILALSATVPNSKEIADWLNAELIQSNYRPVPLQEGVLLENTVYYSDSELEELKPSTDSIHSAVQNVLEREKQILVFVQDRRRAESLAKNLSKRISKQVSEKEKIVLEKLSKKILHSLESPTEQCKTLAEVVSQGIAFHHAGIVQKQRKLIEDAFRARTLKAIIATPTLGAGLNMPCETVLVTSIQRYTENGMTPISVNEFKQMVGRAGRPKYDQTGRAWVIAKHKHEKDDLLQNYIQGSLEDIHSKLGIEPVLRMHALSLIASRYVFDYPSLENFFSKTFYAKQYGDLKQLLSKLHELILELAELKFIQFNSTQTAFTCTPLGKRISDLYLDPLSANTLLQSLEFNLDYFSSVFALCNTFEMKPYINIPAKKEQTIWLNLVEQKDSLPLNFDQAQFTDPDLLQKFYSSSVFQDWIQEVSEQTILENYNLRPGVLHAKLQRMDWLAYAAIELAKLQGKEKTVQLFYRLRARLKHGCKEDLLELVELKGIGRVRARKLVQAHIRSIADIKRIDLVDLEKIIGKIPALKVKQQLKQA
ncbi:MAG: DEAD/DEAH box helicase [Candidatus Diapherotrites archaeon]|nr:DEAD/DEAH box helicase [Candidatus Diapherotrites archaeon]